MVDQDETHPSRKLALREALASEYLLRLGLQNVLFADAARLIGISRDSYGQLTIQTCQPWIVGWEPGMEEVREFMHMHGFYPLPRLVLSSSMVPTLSWYRPEAEVLAYDTKPSNFVLNEDVMAPIDLVLNFFPLPLLEETARLCE